MPRVIRDIAYALTHPHRNRGDLLLPHQPTRPPVLLIHGGGWNALDRHSIEPLADVFLDDGRAVFNIEYRLLSDAPWPACVDDCVAAARFMLAGELGQCLESFDQIVVCGASAGGHLAMMTGLSLGAASAETIIALCGPSRMDFPDGSSEPHFRSPAFATGFFGKTNGNLAAMIDQVSPALVARQRDASPPPLMCVHSRNDLLVPPSHSAWAVEAWRAAGAPAEAFYFDGPGDSHGIWDSEDRASRRPLPIVERAIREHLAALAVSAAQDA